MSGTAARVAGWLERHGGHWYGHPSSVGTLDAPPVFPDAPLDISVALWVDSSWIDITHAVLGGERAQIQLVRGQSAEGAQVDPSRASLELNNRDGQFSPRNPSSWLYGKIGRNTKVRIMIGAEYRFVGEISEWPARWDVTGTDVWTPVEASGVLRRLQQGATPLKSTMRRALTTTSPAPLAYWPCEDGEGATSIASGIGGPPMVLTGTPDFGASTAFKCSGPLPTMSAATWHGAVPAYTNTGITQIRLLLGVPSGGAPDDERIFRAQTGGSILHVDLVYRTAAGGTLEVAMVDTTMTEVSSISLAAGVDGKLVRVLVLLQQDGADLDYGIEVLEVNGGSQTTATTLSSQNITKVNWVAITGSDLDDIVVGHISVHNTTYVSEELQVELDAFAGETAGRRIERLCEQEGIEFQARGDLDETSPVGPQTPAELVTLLRDAADADGGILYEPRDTLGLAYRTRESMYDQSPTLALDYSAKHLSSIEPTDDDQRTRNDVTVTRADGTSAQAVKETGPLSILAPPDGVGRYDEEVTLNLETDAQVEDMAGWRLHLGTVDETRFPVLGVNLAREVFTTDPTLAPAARALDVGDRLTVSNPPAWLPPEDISQLALGFTEVLGNFTHTIAANCAPERPWQQVGVYDDPGDRYSSDGTTLAVAIDETEPFLDVNVEGPLWTDADGEFDIMIGGERITVAAVDNTSSPQLFTTGGRSVNGVVKSHAAGAVVELADPAVYAI